MRRDGWGSPALFPAGSAAMPFAEGEGLWGTVWRGGGGMGWGVGGRVGGGRDSGKLANHRRPWLTTTMMSRPYFSSSQLCSSRPLSLLPRVSIVSVAVAIGCQCDLARHGLVVL